MGDLTAHFSVREFAEHDGIEVPQWARDQLKTLCLHHLEPLRRRFGPVRVMSGYRTRSYNASVGGAPGSFHIYGPGRQGVAADVVPATGSPAQWAAFLESTNPGGLGIYAGHVHVDTRPSRARWSSGAQ